MQEVKIGKEVKKRFPGLKVLTDLVVDVEVKKKSDELEEFKDEVYGRVKKKYTLDSLKDESPFRTYRDFFWKIDTDPTKTRPASEALIRRILQGKNLPTINTLVDSYNLASMQSGIPLAAFDFNSINGNLKLDFATERKEFLGIGMDKPMELDGGEIVVSDEKKPVAIYPYRDSEKTKITTQTREVLLMVCGVPGVEGKLKKAEEIMLDYVTRFCEGEPKDDRKKR